MHVKAVFRESHEQKFFLRKRRDGALDYREEPLHAGAEQDQAYPMPKKVDSRCFDAGGDGTAFGVYEFLQKHDRHQEVFKPKFHNKERYKLF